jgi:hypothetical protein
MCTRIQSAAKGTADSTSLKPQRFEGGHELLCMSIHTSAEQFTHLQQQKLFVDSFPLMS